MTVFFLRVYSRPMKFLNTHINQPTAIACIAMRDRSADFARLVKLDALTIAYGGQENLQNESVKHVTF